MPFHELDAATEASKTEGHQAEPDQGDDQQQFHGKWTRCNHMTEIDRAMRGLELSSGGDPGTPCESGLHSLLMPRTNRSIQSTCRVCLFSLLLLLAAFARTAPAQGLQDIDISMDSMGIQGSFQPGGWVPMRLAVTSNLGETTSVLISLEIPNSDGDVEQYTRSVVLAPGQTATRWLYPHLQPTSFANNLQNTVFTVRIYENLDGVPGSELATGRVSGASALMVGSSVQMNEDMMLIIGTGRMGLSGYMQSRGNSGFVASLNERSVLVNTMPKDLPDRWQGLASYSTIFWSDASPQDLDLDQAKALLTWIENGGRLVIVLQESMDAWGLGNAGRSNYLDASSTDKQLLPSKPPRRVDQVRIASLMQALSKSPLNRNPDATMSIRVFDPENIEAPWEAIAALPGKPDDPSDFGQETTNGSSKARGDIYAIQRGYGHGSVVLVGIDADSIQRRQLQAEGLPQPDVFWNRLIGRRGTIPTGTAYRAYEDEEVLKTSARTFDLGSGKLVIKNIRIGGPSAGLAMLIALGLFITYWVLAGPASFAVLRAKGLVRHSWLGFTCIALVFTLIALLAAWGGRNLLQKEAPVRHLTFLNIVDGVPEIRATSWFSAYLPGYGENEIMVTGENNLLATWSPPPNGTLERFPNTDVFQIATDSPNGFAVPSRATSAHFVAQWRGELGEAWAEMPAEAEKPIKMTAVDGPRQSFEIEGVLRHGLPWTLENVDVICISPFQSRLPSYMVIDGLSYETPIDALPNPGVIARLNQWQKGSAIDLGIQLPGPHINLGSKIGGEYSLTTNMDNLYNKKMRKQLSGTLGIGPDWESLEEESLRMFCQFDVLPQPEFLKNQPGGSQDETPFHFRRWLGRSTDCSNWFLDPCVIIFATIKNAPLPIPLEIDGKPVVSEGTIIVRWVHRLPADHRFITPVARMLEPFQNPISDKSP